ncbi:hypothetical protein SUGI_0463950 [Cryptomeria japonica]|nr:hypothetical protein SUGI_0463950 [Cryptomeria japonica]
MAGGFVVPIGAQGQNYKAKMTTFILITCIVFATGGLIFNYGVGVYGGVISMHPFLNNFFLEFFKKMKEAH